MRLEARFRESVKRDSGKTALVTSHQRLTYGEIDQQSERLAASLVRLGIRPGARIVMLQDNEAEAVIGFFAIWKADAVACPLYPSMKAEKLAAILVSTGAAAVIASARLIASVDTAISLAGTTPITIISQARPDTAPSTALQFEDLSSHEISQELPAPNEDCDALALLIHTSGSTGHPKGVMLSHANVDAACQSIISYLGNTSADIVLNVLPLSFGYGITQVVTMASVGGTLVLERSFAFPRKILERLKEERVTGFSLVPAMAALIGGMKDLTPGFLPELRYITSAAAALPPAVSLRLQELLPRSRIFIMYGQSECMRISYLPPEHLTSRPTSVGKAIPGTRIFIADENGQPVGAGTIGELMVEGPHIMAGYWQNEPATARALAPTEEGRILRTGDLFRMDKDGFFYFICRKDDIIKTRGEKVSPQEVERALYALPGIREAAVGGVDDPIFGQIVQAYVALEPGASLTEKDIIRHCAGQLEDYMVPKGVEFRSSLPKTTTGKIRITASPP